MTKYLNLIYHILSVSSVLLLLVTSRKFRDGRSYPAIDTYVMVAGMITVLQFLTVRVFMDTAVDLAYNIGCPLLVSCIIVMKKPKRETPLVAALVFAIFMLICWLWLISFRISLFVQALMFAPAILLLLREFILQSLKPRRDKVYMVLLILVSGSFAFDFEFIFLRPFPDIYLHSEWLALSSVIYKLYLILVFLIYPITLYARTRYVR